MRRPAAFATVTSGPRYQPLVVLWEDGTVMRLRSPSRLVPRYVRGKADPEALAKYWEWVRMHADSLAAATPRFVLDSDDDTRSFTMWLEGTELSRVWMRPDSHNYPELEEVVARLLRLPLVGSEDVRVARNDSSFARWYVTPR
jgi:hypothetical protein